MRCAFSSTDLRVAGAAGAPHDAWLSLVSAIYKAICKTLKTIKSKAHNQLCQHWELRGILKPSPCVADEGRLNTLNKQLGTELIPQSSGARDTGRFFLSPAFKCKSLSPEAHSALFFLYENYCIVVLFQRGHHSSKKREWGQAGTPSSELSPGTPGLCWASDPISDRNSTWRMRIWFSGHTRLHTHCDAGGAGQAPARRLSTPCLSNNTNYWLETF